MKPTLPLLLLAALAPGLHARPLKALTPERFESSKLFKDYPASKKTDISDLVKEGAPERRTLLYDFAPTGGFHDGFRVALERAGAETKRLIINWVVEDDPKHFMWGKRMEQVRRIFHTLEMDAGADPAVAALAEMVTGKAGHSKEVKLPSDNNATVFLVHVGGSDVLGLELQSRD